QYVLFVFFRQEQSGKEADSRCCSCCPSADQNEAGSEEREGGCSRCQQSQETIVERMQQQQCNDSCGRCCCSRCQVDRQEIADGNDRQKRRQAEEEDDGKVSRCYCIGRHWQG